MIEEKRLALDYQTLSELEIIHSEGPGLTVFEKLNKTVTPGGRDLLRKVFRNPLCEKEKIQRRQEALKYILTRLDIWDVTAFKELMDQVEKYYYSKAEPVTSKRRVAMYLEGLIYIIKYREFKKTINEGTRISLLFISLLSDFTTRLFSDDLTPLLKEKIEDINRILATDPFAKITPRNVRESWSFSQLIYFDKQFREIHKKEMIKLVSLLYDIDVLISMAKATREFGLSFPEFLDSEDPIIETEALYHLFVKDPVSNSISFTSRKNFLFLTGPNMSGKTTFLKSCGIAIFLAHLGMGVPARSMKLTVFECIFSSLNTTDNLSLGYSYFFSEVLRIKKAAESLQKYERSFMIFDELFKGTNVKDAFDGSVLVIEGLMKWKYSVFILSSHLLELEKAIRNYSNAFFQHFDSDVIQGKPYFSFGLHEGISKERLGLLILKNEKIEKLLNPEYDEG